MTRLFSRIGRTRVLVVALAVAAAALSAKGHIVPLGFFDGAG